MAPKRVLSAAISTVIINSGQLSSVVYFVVYQFAVVVVDERFLDLQISVIKDGRKIDFREMMT